MLPGTNSASEKLLGAFPVIKRIGDPLRASQIPVIIQATATDCGAACLAMVLGYYGHHVGLEEVREAMDVGRDGVSARAILEAASLFQLRGRGVGIDLKDMAHLPRGAILHWNFSHFVVFDKVARDGIYIVDPAIGRFQVPMEDARKAFTGVALLLEKTQTFAGAKAPNTIAKHLRAAFDGTDEWWRIALMSIMLELLALVLPMINGRLVDRVVPRNDMHLLYVLLAGLGVTVLFHFGAAVVRGQLLLQLRTRFDAKMSFGFLEHLLKLPYGFFERRQTADLQMRVNSVATIREVLTGAVLSGVIDGVMVISHLAFLAFMSLKVMAIAMVIVVVQGAVYIGTRRKMMELASGSVAKQAEAANALNELLSGMESLKASGCEQRASQAWAAKYVDVMNLGLRQGTVSTFTEALVSTMHVVAPMVLLVGGIVEILDRSSHMTLGQMLSANALAVGFINPTMNLIGTLQRLQTTRVHLNRIDDVLKTAPEQDYEKGGIRVAPQLRGQITLDRVSFRYAQKLPLAVKNVSVNIKPGECVAIVGRSGSGKTTLGRLLLGLYNPSEGNVRFDGLGLAQLDLRSVRRQLGVVIQRPHIFGSTIRANIALGDPQIPLEHVKRAAARSCIQEDVERMPLQYDTPVVAGGASLSGGQRQRIALARALVHDPAVLLLDEATSALDAITEAAVQKQLEELSCTRIIIAHRLSTVVNANRILVMEDGQLVEQGNHAELLARGGAYARLVDAQLGQKRGQQGENRGNNNNNNNKNGNKNKNGNGNGNNKKKQPGQADVVPLHQPQLARAVGGYSGRMYDPDAPTWHGGEEEPWGYE